KEKMSKLKVVTATGYTKDEALASIQLDAVITGNATIAWKNAGKPEGDELVAFATKYVSEKVKGAPEGIGYQIVVEPGVEDTRVKPYTVTNVVTKGARKFLLSYEGYVDTAADGTGG